MQGLLQIVPQEGGHRQAHATRNLHALRLHFLHAMFPCLRWLAGATLKHPVQESIMQFALFPIKCMHSLHASPSTS